MNLIKSLEKAYHSGEKGSNISGASTSTDAYIHSAIIQKLIMSAFSAAESKEKRFSFKADTTIVVAEPHFRKNINIKLSEDDIMETCSLLGFLLLDSYEDGGKLFYEIAFL